MYSVVLMTMLTAGGAEAPDFGWRGCRGCHGCHGCHGYAFSGHGCHGCHGGWGCHGCWSSCSCSGWGCSGCWSSCSGWGCSGCWSSCHGCMGSCWGCYGSVSYYTCSGCFGGGYAAPVASAPVVIREPAVRVMAPATGGEPGTTPLSKEEAEAVRRVLKELRETKKAPGFVPPPPGGESTSAPARLTVQLPADARLWVDGTVCPLTSDMRSFNTPALAPGRQYFYTLRMEVEREGRTLSTSRRVFVAAGQAVSVDLNDLSVATTVSR